MTRSYSLNCGQYVLMEGDRPIGRVLDEVSLALDKAEGALYRHGAPEFVQSWAAEQQRKLRGGGSSEMADNLVVLTGRFPLDELNKCVASLNAARLCALAVAGQLPEEPLLPAEPARNAPAPAREVAMSASARRRAACRT